MVPTTTTVEKSEEVNLDLSTRKKIIIQTRPSKSVAGNQNPSRTLSIFKSAVDQRPCIENTAKLESKPVQGLDQNTATESNVKRKHPALPSRQLPETMVFISSPKADASSSNTPTPEPIKLILNPNYPSPYTEEYAKCPCTIGSHPPCQRCQLMCLSDRFCQLVDAQCQKWGIPTRDHSLRYTSPKTNTPA